MSDARLPPIPEEELSFERFKETRDVESFDCGNQDLNDFLCTEEVSKYEKEGFGYTYLVYWRGNLVAYMTVPRKADKAYIQDPGLRAFLAIKAEIADLEKTGEIGQAVEGVLFDHLRRLQFNVLDHRNGKIGYWSKPEIDFLVQLPKGWLAVEAKYSANPKVRGHGLEDLLAARKDALGIVACRRDFSVSDSVITMPAWMLAALA